MKFNKKKLVLLTSLALSSQAFAATIYENDTTKVDMSGAFLLDFWQPVHAFEDHDFNTSRSTLGFGVEQQLGNGWSADVKFEWDNITSAPTDASGEKSDDQFRTRLGYFSVHHDELGSLRFGKQYSAYHDVAGYMDNLIVFDPDATPIFSDGKDGGFMATARGDDLVTYRNSFENLHLSAQYGFEENHPNPNVNLTAPNTETLTRESNYAFAASYDFDFGLSLGATHLVNKVELSDGVPVANLDASDEQKITTIAAKYSYEAFKVTAAYTDGTKAHETGYLAYSDNYYADATGMDIYAEYYFAIGLRPYVYLSNVDFDDEAIQGERSIYSMGLSYHAAPNFIISGEVRKVEEEGLSAGDQDDTISGITVIYAF